MTPNERRTGNIDMIRSFSDRRKYRDPNYKGPERRSGQERRTCKDRRRRN
jgi:hypothetical protein